MPGPATTTDDAFLWLEEVAGERALDWVRRETGATRGALCDDAFKADAARIKAILQSDANIPFVGGRAGYLYNLWQDATAKRGLWRRTTLDEFRRYQPGSSGDGWDVMLDVDALGRTEGEDWVFGGSEQLPPHYDRALLRLSRGGSDAVVIREFDMTTRRFLNDGFLDDGFALPEGKSAAAWLDRDTLLVTSALGAGPDDKSMATTSGYARTVRRWRRGTPFASAEVVFESRATDVWTRVDVDRTYTLPLVSYARGIDFFNSETWIEHPTRGRVRVDVPTDAWNDTRNGWLLLRLRSAWTVADVEHPADSLLAIDLERFLGGSRVFEVLFEPGPRRILRGFSWSKGHLALDILDNVQCRPLIGAPPVAGQPAARWSFAAVLGLPPAATLSIWPRDSRDCPEFFVSWSDPLTPPSLGLLVPGTPVEVLKRQPAEFDVSGLAVTVHEAISSDGERIPYFQVARKDLALHGDNATILTGYGGFEIAMLPSYLAVTGAAWLEQGGVFVLACLRGGGEFGARWHKAGIREKKVLAHDDFAAIAGDLIARGVTRRERLAATGGSNGGLLVGNMLTRYPHLFGAIHCAVPLLDMRRYSRLLAGASWIGEYGDPDVAEDWEFMRRFSAYQNLEAGRDYPPILFTTSAKDDRVHPGHARKMAATMQALGYKPMFYEPEIGGHGFADKAQEADSRALMYAFLRHTIGEPGS